MEVIEWVSVKERQPEESGLILVTANDIVSSWVEVVHAYICPEYEYVIWENLDDGEEYAPIVTHWAKFPAKPEGE